LSKPENLCHDILTSNQGDCAPESLEECIGLRGKFFDEMNKYFQLALDPELDFQIKDNEKEIRRNLGRVYWLGANLNNYTRGSPTVNDAVYKSVLSYRKMFIKNYKVGVIPDLAAMLEYNREEFADLFAEESSKLFEYNNRESSNLSCTKR